VQVLKLWCLGGTYTTARVLPPGQSAGPGDLGDSTCFAGEASFQIDLFGTQPQPQFSVGGDGMEVFNGLPVTDGGAPHVITELFSGVSASFEIAGGTVTRVIFLNYEEEDLIEDVVPTESDPVDEGMDPGVVGEAVSETGEGAVTEDPADAEPEDGGGGGVESVVEGRAMTTTGIGPEAGSNSIWVLALAGAVGLAGAGALLRPRTR
jgi:hypothetical protein